MRGRVPRGEGGESLRPIQVREPLSPQFLFFAVNPDIAPKEERRTRDDPLARLRSAAEQRARGQL